MSPCTPARAAIGRRLALTDAVAPASAAGVVAAARAARALLCAVALACATAGPARASVAAEPAGSLPPVAVPTTEGWQPADEIDRLRFLGRSQPDLAAVELQKYTASLKLDDPRLLEALMELGADYVALADGDAVEQVARRIEALPERVALARPAAMVLRGHWLQLHGEVSRAERQFIEASALMPARIPDFLRLRLLTSYAEVKSRGGHYDEAVARYNDALKLVDETGPPWLRADLRGALAGVLMDAGQNDKAAELTLEQMRLSTEAGDELGMSRACTNRAIQISEGTDSAATLAALRAALEHAHLSGNKRAIVIGTANIADYYLRHGDYRTAYETSQSALPMAREIHSEAAESLALANTGLALISMRRKDEGVPLVREAMAMEERAGSARDIANAAEDLGRYLERAGYLEDALAAYRQYRQISDELNQQDRQRALIELQEGFANEQRQHELDMLSRDGSIKDEELLHHDLQIKQWTAAGAASLLLLIVVGVLARRLRSRNQQLSRSNEQLRIQAEIDPLTGLSNRRHFQAVMAQHHARRLEGTLYLIDIDHFKQINDRCGHAGGDAVLVEIAQRLRRALRPDDLIVRWGGEEFLVLVRPLPQSEAEALAQRLLSGLACAPVALEGQAIGVSASIGYGQFPLPGQDGSEIDLHWERAIALVDTAMYMAKARGRNGACAVRQVRADDASAVEEVIRSLDTAAEGGLVELHLQAGPEVQEVPA